MKRFVVREPDADSTTVVRLRRKAHSTILQDCDVYIGRKCTRGGWQFNTDSKWANPFRLGDAGLDTVEQVLERYERHVRDSPELMASLGELEGKRLGCWCKNAPSDPCHGDVLLRLVRERKHPRKERPAAREPIPIVVSDSE